MDPHVRLDCDAVLPPIHRLNTHISVPVAKLSAPAKEATVESSDAAENISLPVRGRVGKET